MTAAQRMIPIVAAALLSSVPIAAQNEPLNRANYKLAAKYSSSVLRQFTYSTSVSPTWIGKTDRFWYSFRTSAGIRYWLVDPSKQTKVPLFDHAKLAARLSVASKKPVDANELGRGRLTRGRRRGSRQTTETPAPTKPSISGLSVDDNVTKLTFSFDGRKYEYELATDKLTDKGPAPATRTPPLPRNIGDLSREELRRLFEQRRRQQNDNQNNQDNRDTRQRGRRGQRGGRTSRTGRAQDATTRNRSMAPDKLAYVYARDNNLYYVTRKPKPEPKVTTATAKTAKPAASGSNGKAGSNGRANGDGGDEATSKTGPQAKTNGVAKEATATKKTAPAYIESKPIQLSTDGAEDYSFGGASRSSSGTTRTGRRGRGRFGGSPRINWSKNSMAFYATRRDTRGVAELYLVDSLAQPRPALRKYSYPMPGDEKIRKTELHVFDRKSMKLRRVAPQWKDESYSNIHWLGDTNELRFVRRDRLLRHVELCSFDPITGEAKTLLREGFANGSVGTQSVRHLEKRKQLIWWSERSGWGQYYLYCMDGKLVNAITSGQFRASRIVDVDEDKGILWFRGNGREPGENIYYEHLYRTFLDGTGLTLLDPGNATHRSSLSPTKKYIVDNCSRVDMPSIALVRDAAGNKVMDLEQTDMSKLHEMGWKPPERFTVKAADGVTDLFGNMWKPFDFDPHKRYPIIVHVYPGPQQEGVRHTFSAINGEQELAQLGFIVIQVGHRGGTPKRSKAYEDYGYKNLRDYGLADKKAAIEQLAAMHPFIDIERVGIYGHSGGGFMTAAAMLKEPYNKFFKVGVASSGNHDNNIYNNAWGERYHGMDEVAVTEQTDTTRRRGLRGGEGRGRFGSGRGFRGRRGTEGGGRRGVRSGTGERGTQTTGRRRRIGNDPRQGTKTGTQRTTRQGETKQTKTNKATAKRKTEFKIKIPTNAELAAGLEGKLLLVHGEMDTNVHPASTMRLVDALIKANKRFDMIIIPGAGHGYGRAQAWFTQRMHEYFAEHLLGDRQPGADILDKSKRQGW